MYPYTGESVPRKKTVDNDRLLYGGTHVNEGEGHLLVLAVGANSRHGTILVLLSQREEEVRLHYCCHDNIQCNRWDLLLHGLEK